MKAEYLKKKHEAGLGYADYVATGKPQQQQDWQTIYDQASLTEAQAALLGSFTRKLNVIVLSGIWCGDCVQQCPLIQRIAEGAPDASGDASGDTSGGASGGGGMTYAQSGVDIEAGDRTVDLILEHSLAEGVIDDVP